MTKFQPKIWKPLFCANKSCNHQIGLTNSQAVIFGGMFIQQKRTYLMCQRCGRVRRFCVRGLDREVVRFLGEGELPY